MHNGEHMNIFTYSEARQRLSHLLTLAKETGKVMIKRRDGSVFSLTPENPDQSPLDVKSISTDISIDEILSVISESRAPKEIEGDGKE